MIILTYLQDITEKLISLLMELLTNFIIACRKKLIPFFYELFSQLREATIWLFR